MTGRDVSSFYEQGVAAFRSGLPIAADSRHRARPGSVVVTVRTNTAAIYRLAGCRDYVIACGAGLGWNVCYSCVTEICPLGCRTVPQEAGFNRRELTIACPTPAQPRQSAVSQCTYESPAFFRQ